ncbi:MAG: hypothetical protein P1U56_16170 [Saprospiraceae bacterium]|nr:hypothetical protein [Saprospiraceae bacterium]
MIKHFLLFWLAAVCCNPLASQTTAIMVSDVKVSKSKFQPTAQLIKEHMEQSLLEHDYITVLDRDMTYLTERERRVQRSESFMDGKYVEQDKAIGADWIFEIVFDDQNKVLTLQILDVETDEKLFFKDYKIKRFLEDDLTVERPRYFGRYIEEQVGEILKEMDVGSRVDIQIIELSGSKGKKANEVVLYCKNGCNLKRSMKLVVYHEIENESNTKALYKKKVKIGKIEVKHVENDKVYIAKVKDGSKEIFELFTADNKLICINE